ncbi:MAG: DNA polymerase IV [bacterium]|nr:DNA polymerase IV [bacterium]
MRAVVHVDMDAFYASVEKRDAPRLRGLPVAVGGGGERGVVMTASYEARAFGVGSAMPTAIARRRCPDLVVLPPRFDAYQAASRAVRAVLDRVTDLVEPLSLDEAYLDVSHPIGRPDGGEGPPPSAPVDVDAAAELAAGILSAIHAEAGLTASAGVATGKFLAKVASAAKKPGGLTVVRPEAALAFLATLPIERFFGVGPKTAARLHAVGIATGADLRDRSAEELQALLGKTGAFLYGVVRDDDPRPVVPDRARKSIGAERTFARDLRDANELAPELAKACAAVGGRLTRSGLAARTVTVKVRYADFRIVTRAHTPRNPVGDAAELWRVAERLAFATPRPAGAVRLIGVAASGLIDRGARVVQLDLFDAL